MKKALFVTFEGIEGSGKSTQIRAVERHFQTKGLHVFTTREPGGSPLGDGIRNVLLRSSSISIDPISEIFLMEAARRQHVVDVLLPHMKTDDLILCDRFADSSVAYQGGGRGLDIAWIHQLNEKATGHLKPDLTFLLDAPPEKTLPRALKRLERAKAGKAEDRFEKENLDFHKRVRESFIQLAKNEPGRFLVLDATQESESISKIIIEKVESSLRNLK